MSLKQAAEELLKIADEIEVQADSVTKFVCDKCNHTATLAKINEKRKTAATEAGENVIVSPVTVNDQVSCPACDDGVMAYVASEESEKFYVEEKAAGEEVTPEEIAEEKKETPEEQAMEEKGKKLHDEPHKKASEPIDYDSLKRYQA
jgi:ubiquitin